MKRTILILLLLLSGACNLLAQPASIPFHGICEDIHSHFLLPGVTIYAVNRKKVLAISDNNGSFSVVVYPSDTLEFTATGFHKTLVQIDTVSGTTLQVLLRSAENELSEVTVQTGYQARAKQTTTGSYAFINRDILDRQNSSFILDKLNGSVSGMQNGPSVGPPLTIRGISSIVGPQAPLIILDNFPYDGDIHNINPNDVENITVLKDAAAASIWGTRAGNGAGGAARDRGKYKPWCSAKTGYLCFTKFFGFI